MLPPTYTYRQPGLTPGDLVRLGLLGSPVAVLALLLWNPHLDPHLPAPGMHFVVVTLASGMAALVGLLVLLVAERLRDARAFSLGLAFCTIAGFFFIHGLLTPGFVITGVSNGIGWSPLLALMLGSVCLYMSTVRPRPGEEPWVFRRRRDILVLFVALWVWFLGLSFASPRFLDGHPTSLSEILEPASASRSDVPEGAGEPLYGFVGVHQSHGATPAQAQFPWIAGSLVLTAAVLLVLTTVRYARNYRLSRLPLHATIVAGMVLLIESLLSFAFASTWRVSWWEYHMLVLLGVGTILYGLTVDYRRDASMTRTISAVLLSSSVEALEQSYSEVLTALVAAVEAKDPYTKGHSEKVARLAAQIGEALGLPPEQLRILYQAGLLHDIGKIGITDWILNKPGRLTPAEFAVVKGHPARSEEMIGRIPSLRPTLKAIRWHHERLDGSGYPDGISGDAIPLEPRILAVADVFDAMRSGRSYRPARSDHEALVFLKEQAGRQFDPRCVEALIRIIQGQAGPVKAGVGLSRLASWAEQPSS
ncbi:MAG: HD-GYP domain-containing protein [Armatimonadetes bacterium]|nr:HD-GYP domain-containing protein [Armatimonadota bacterium]